MGEPSKGRQGVKREDIGINIGSAGWHFPATTLPSGAVWKKKNVKKFKSMNKMLILLTYKKNSNIVGLTPNAFSCPNSWRRKKFAQYNVNLANTRDERRKGGFKFLQIRCTSVGFVLVLFGFGSWYGSTLNSRVHLQQV